MGEDAKLDPKVLEELLKIVNEGVTSGSIWKGSPFNPFEDDLKVDPAPIDYPKEYEKFRKMPVAVPKTPPQTLIQLTEEKARRERQVTMLESELALAVEARDKLYKCWLDSQNENKELRKQLEEAKQGKRFRSLMR